jgi:hypothetical protein
MPLRESIGMNLAFERIGSMSYRKRLALFLVFSWQAIATGTCPFAEVNSALLCRNLHTSDLAQFHWTLLRGICAGYVAAFILEVPDADERSVSFRAHLTEITVRN